MSVRFARPNLSELVFHLYGRSVHPELFQIFAEAEVWREAFTAVVRICEAGHTVTFRHRGLTVTEVTAALEQPLPQRKRFVERRLKGQRDESFRFDCGLRYHVSYQVEQLDLDVFLTFHEELLLDCCHANVAHRFPSANRLFPGPLSLIRADADGNSLLVHAFHTFPESCAVVKTQSLFEL